MLGEIFGNPLFYGFLEDFGFTCTKMLDIELMDVDLSIVKKEKIELDDYEKESVNILDNFISEHDYNDFPPASMVSYSFCFYHFFLLLSFFLRNSEVYNVLDRTKENFTFECLETCN